ncbi:cytochrome c peroxidase [Gangjinia marincola]|uniref:Cytochrome c peroxidase n=1 Tax=Gangjinia marincola TaxID=578463 RepID=A0ABN1ME80_9FLAO
MKRLSIVMLVIATLLANSCSSPPKVDHTYASKALPLIQKKYNEDFDALRTESNLFVKLSQSYHEKQKSSQKLQQAYASLREKFKKVEYIVAYLDEEAYEKTLNGAPLLKVEPKTADFMIISPKGFQVLDELMANPVDNSEEIVDVSTQLAGDIKKMQSYIGSYKFSNRQYFEASRQALVRLAALGITGFDTPGTLKGIEDAVYLIHTLRETFSFYDHELHTIKRPDLKNDTQEVFASAEAQLRQNKTFNSFDRLSFIKDVINPLYRKYKQVHVALGYETLEEISPYASSLTYEAENIFDQDFLNKFYYVSLQEDEQFELKAALGKLLFYDPVLSADNTMSCATCHNPEKAFTDGNVLSLGSDGKPLKRNTLTLNYSGLATGFFHDLRVERLEDQFEHVIVHDNEFNTTYNAVIQKLQHSPTYTNLFTEAFPEYDGVAAHTIDYALTAYILKLNAFDSPLDLYMRGELVDLPNDVKRGFNLFTGKAACATCHFIPTFNGTVPPLYTESESEVLGVSEAFEDKSIMDDDLGRFANGRETAKADHLKNSFKTPTLRNIALTAPYMHNGIYNTLEEVMDFYNKGGGAGHGMEVPHQTLAPDALDLSEQEINDLIAFMNALTDQTKFKAPIALPSDFTQKELNDREMKIK